MGTYTPMWTAQFAKPLPWQVIAITQRDQADTLAIVNAARQALGNSPLPPIEDFHIGPIFDAQPPCLFVRWTGLGFQAEYQNTRRSIVRLECALTVPDTDPQMGTIDAADYCWLLDMILTTAPGADWETPLPIDQETLPNGQTAPNAQGTVQNVFVESHTLLETAKDERETPSLAVHLTVLFELEET